MPIYLDNAATSFPKPESVYAAIDHTNRNSAVAAGRGTYQRAADVQRLIANTRDSIAQLINAENASQVSFAFSGTDALSTAILGSLKPGDHVITSVVDHTSVLRPIWHLENFDVESTIVHCDLSGLIETSAIESAIKPNTKLVCLTHASNVTGAIQPIEEIGALCREKNIVFLLDAAQTVGHIPIDVQAIGCDLLAAPGHKALLGPLGTAFLYTGESIAESLSPLRFGGTGSTGDEFQQPMDWPRKFESGNLNVSGIAGLQAGIQWLGAESQTSLNDLETATLHIFDQLSNVDGVHVYGSRENMTSTISFNIEGVDCQSVGMILDSQYQIECRTGLHCAPLIHEHIGSAKFGGTVRFSLGLFNTSAEVDLAIDAVKSIATEMKAANQ